MPARAGARSLPIIAAFGVATLGLGLAGCAGSPSSPVAGNGGASHYRTGHPHYTVKPYQVNGVWYYPRADYSYDETGTASWYGPGFDRRPTADGEIYDMNGVSAAHKTLPLPSIVQVTNLQNGRELRLRVNDRGPFVGDRLIDLSRRAAQLLGFERSGTAPVRVQIVKDDSIRVAAAAMRGEFGDTAYAEAAPSAAAVALAAAPPRSRPPVRMASAAPPSMRANEIITVPPPVYAQPVYAQPVYAPIPQAPPAPVVAAAAPPPVPVAEPPRRVAAAPQRQFWPSLIAEAHADTLRPPPAASVRHPAREASADRHLARVAASEAASLAAARRGAGSFVQAGAFAVPENARRVRARIAALGNAEIIRTTAKGAALYRVRLGPVAGDAEARRLLEKVVARGYPDARLVDR